MNEPTAYDDDENKTPLRVRPVRTVRRTGAAGPRSRIAAEERFCPAPQVVGGIDHRHRVDDPTRPLWEAATLTFDPAPGRAEAGGDSLFHELFRPLLSIDPAITIADMLTVAYRLGLPIAITGLPSTPRRVTPILNELRRDVQDGAYNASAGRTRSTPDNHNRSWSPRQRRAGRPHVHRSQRRGVQIATGKRRADRRGGHTIARRVFGFD